MQSNDRLVSVQASPTWDSFRDRGGPNHQGVPSVNLNLEHDVQPSDNPSVDTYLYDLAHEFALAFRDPEDRRFAVPYRDSDAVNAYASLSGHIVITGGRVNALDSENGLVMSLAHTMAHVVERQPIGTLRSR